MAKLGRVVFLTFLVTQAHMAYGAKNYIAAVVEHETVYATPNGKEFPESDGPIDRQTALDMMMKNLDIYEERVKEARLHNVEIIVFPENGIHGYEYTREGVFPFLQHIPDPKSFQKPVSPCDDVEHFTESPVVRRLSCIAKENKIVIVANLGDVEYCKTPEQPCNKDRRLQFNTDVVFDSDGTFLLKYHKHFLFHEDEYDTPEHCSYPVFTTSFGVRFGVLICFDLLFEKPALSLVHDLGIRNIAFPTAWPNFFPMFGSYTFHHSWSWTNKVNLLAANHHRFTAGMTGSGIYSLGEVKGLYFNHSLGSDGQLLIAELPALDEDTVDNTDVETNHDKNGCTEETPRTTTEDFAEAMKSASANEDGHCVRTAKEKENFLQDEVPNQEARDTDIFKSTLLFDEYNFIKLTQASKGNITICNEDICCNLVYSLNNSTENNEYYALGVYTGLNKVNPVHQQVCALVRCAGASNDSCGQPVHEASTVFESFSLRGNFSEETITYPIILLGDGQLVSPSLDGIRYDGSSLRGVLAKPLVSATLFGRIYRKDNYFKCRDPIAPKQHKVLS